MSPSTGYGGLETLVPLRPRSADELELLRRRLRLGGDGLELVFVALASLDTARRVIDALRSDPGLQVRELDERRWPDEGLVAAAREAFRGPPGSAARPVAVLGGADERLDLLAAQLEIAQLATAAPSEVRGTLLLVVSPEALELLRGAAPRAWAARAADFEIAEPRRPQPIEGLEARLIPVAPPRDEDERARLEAALGRTPEGARRGEIAHRLAELVYLAGDDPLRAAALFGEAAGALPGGRSRAVARVNQAAMLLAAGRAREAATLLEAEAAPPADSGDDVAAWSATVIARASLRLGVTAHGLDEARKAAVKARALADRALRAESLLLRAAAHAAAGRPDAAVRDVEAAAGEAGRAADPLWAGVARRLDLCLAALSGRRGVFEPALAGVEPEEAAAVVAYLDESGAAEAAARLWESLVERAGEAVATEAAVGLLERRLLGEGRAPELLPWRARLGDALPAQLEARAALLRGDPARAVAALEAADPAGLDARLCWMAALARIGDTPRALAHLDALLADPGERAALLRRLGLHARQARSADRLPPVESTVAALLLRRLGEAPVNVPVPVPAHVPVPVPDSPPSPLDTSPPPPSDALPDAPSAPLPSESPAPSTPPSRRSRRSRRR